MSFTIVIATHGEQHWEDLALSRALPSAQAQGCDVLIGHDPDGTRAEVRNALSAKAAGDWIITLDADDELAPGYVTAMGKVLYPKTHLLTPMVQYVKRGRAQRPEFMPEIPLEQGNWMVVGTAVPRGLFLEIGGWRTFTGSGVLNQWDDWDLWIRCVKAGAGIVKVPDAVYVAHVSVSPHYARTRAQTEAWLKEIREANGIGG
jgi:GT2 family glycosyltransferase